MSDDSRPMDDVVCPLCGIDGWPSSLAIYAFAARCGSAWSGGGGFVSQSEPCREIARLRLELGLRDVLEAV